MQRIIVKRTAQQQIAVKRIERQSVSPKNSYVIVGTFDPYTGDYNVTPSNTTQVLHTKGKGMEEDIIISPIPKNYGLITYNGFELTVS